MQIMIAVCNLKRNRRRAGQAVEVSFYDSKIITSLVYIDK